MKLPRLSGWLLATVLLLAVVALLAPHQLPVTLYKLSLISMAGVAGYWLDRELFPYARPDSFIAAVDDFDIDTDMASEGPLLPSERVGEAAFVFGMAMLRRAIIVGCAMLAIGLGA